jgi:hypothetical protein
MVVRMALVIGMRCVLPNVFMGFLCIANPKMNLNPKVEKYILINSRSLNPN